MPNLLQCLEMRRSDPGRKIAVGGAGPAVINMPPASDPVTTPISEAGKAAAGILDYLEV